MSKPKEKRKPFWFYKGLLILSVVFLSSLSTTYAYWQGEVLSANTESHVTITIGDWTYAIDDIDPDTLPLGPNFAGAVDPDYGFAYSFDGILDTMTGITKIPVGTYISSNGKLYKTAHTYYAIPIIAGGPSGIFASYYFDEMPSENIIEWDATLTYKANRVVKVAGSEGDEFYIATTQSKNQNPQNHSEYWRRISQEDGEVNLLESNWKYYFGRTIIPIEDIEGNKLNYELPDYSKPLRDENNNLLARALYDYGTSNKTALVA